MKKLNEIKKSLMQNSKIDKKKIVTIIIYSKK